MDAGSPVVIKGSQSCWGFGLRHLRSASLLGPPTVSPRWVLGAPAESRGWEELKARRALSFPAGRGGPQLPDQLPLPIPPGGQ